MPVLKPTVCLSFWNWKRDGIQLPVMSCIETTAEPWWGFDEFVINRSIFRLFYGLPSRLFYIAHLEHCTIQYLEYFSTHYGSLQSSLCFSHLQSNLIYRSDCTLCSVKRLYLCYLTVTKKKWWIQPQKADKHSIHRRKINKKVTDLPPLGADYTLLKNCKQKFMYKNVSQTWRNVSET